MSLQHWGAQGAAVALPAWTSSPLFVAMTASHQMNGNLLLTGACGMLSSSALLYG